MASDNNENNSGYKLKILITQCEFNHLSSIPHIFDTKEAKSSKLVHFRFFLYSPTIDLSQQQFLSLQSSTNPPSILNILFTKT